MPVYFTPGAAIFDVTPVENLFIETLMADAPGDFVKVYLYGLMLCYHPELPQSGTAEVALALNLSTAQVQAAFGYWQERGLLNVVRSSPLDVEYFNLKLAYSNASSPIPTPRDDEFTALCEQLTAMFTGERVLNHNEIRLVRAWREELGMEPAAIVLLVQMCREEKGAQVHFNYIDAVIKERSSQGERTLEETDEYIKRREAQKSGAARILSRWNIRRAPSDDEMALWRKWTAQWGMEEGAVTAALSHLVWAQYPSFALLDGMLGELYAQGVTTADGVSRRMEEQDKERGAVKAIAQALGLRGASQSAGLTQAYNAWRRQGFTDEAILAACYYLRRGGGAGVPALEALLAQWQGEGLTSTEGIQAWLSQKDASTRAVTAWFKRWGLTRTPTQAEIQACHVVTEQWRMPEELVNKAVEDAMGAQYPLRYAYAVLKRCHEGGVTSLEGYASQGNPPQAAPREEEDFSRDYMDIFAPGASL